MQMAQPLLVFWYVHQTKWNKILGQRMYMIENVIIQGYFHNAEYLGHSGKALQFHDHNMT